ncbi:MAG: acyltransferase [Lachnospiraceae bacterium]|nr:acyltransferase [Lachnospiraceae bacterium]
MSLKDKIFSKEIVNSGRQPELDLAKAVLIFCLALVHCIIECTSGEQLAHGIPFFFDSVLGGPLGAPMFMFAMGFGMVYTKRHTPKDYVRRGIRIGITSYVLNICRFLIPFLAGYLLTEDIEKYIKPIPYRIFGNDILQFAALAMIMIALFVKLHMSNAAMILVCLAMSFLGTFLKGLDVGSPAGNIFLGYLIGTEDPAGAVFSDFPLFNWLIVPVSGYVFGGLLLHVKNKNLFYGILSTVGILVCIVYFPPAISGGWGMFGEGQNCYYHIITVDVLVSIAAAIGMLGIYHVVAPRLPKRMTDCVGEISRNINVVYCIHWVFVMWITNVILYILRGTQELPVTLALLLGTGISIVSIVAAHFWSATKAKQIATSGKYT